MKFNCLHIWVFVAFFLFGNIALSQNCEQEISKKSLKIYKKAVENLRTKKSREARGAIYQLTKAEPNFAEAHYKMGELYINEKPANVKTAKKYFEKAISICPDSVLYAYYYLGKIYYGNRKYDEAIVFFKHFLNDVDLIKTDADYYEIQNYLDYSIISAELIGNPVPFKPTKINGLSTTADEYLPFISADNEFALFTRRIKKYERKGLTAQWVEKEIFSYSLRNTDGVFEAGWEMPFPFNKMENEGAATLTIDNNDLYYTVCFRKKSSTILNCDLFHSHFENGIWSKTTSIGDNINSPDSWESQPSVTSDGSTLYFSSNRKGGLGGSDIYKITKLANNKWSDPVNLGAPTNTPANEKSPFIHTDSQTLYFSSEGHKGVGGYDIFYTRQDQEGKWLDPKNIGYPINSFDDDLSFFVSTDGHYGYYASNRLGENDMWNLYTFPLYEEARPQKVLLIKGEIDIEEQTDSLVVRVQLQNIISKKITEIPVNRKTGKYVAALIFKDDQILTVKKEGYVYSSRYLSTQDTTLKQPKKIDIKIKKVEVGRSYKINDIYFATNDYKLSEDAQKIIDEFFMFLNENPNIHVEIQGHTDNIGQNTANLLLSKNRAESVYNHLINKGTSSSRITFKGYGESMPIENNNTTKGRSKNRRTVFLITKK